MIRPDVCTIVGAFRQVVRILASGASIVGAFRWVVRIPASGASIVGAFRRNAPTPINAEAHDLEERIGENVTMLLEEVN